MIRVRARFAIILLLYFPGVCFCADHTSNEIETIQSADSRPCSFFRLKGVTEADSVVPNNPWFAVPITHHDYNVIASILLTAYTTGALVGVTTTGGIQCGHAEVLRVYFSF